MVAFCVNYILIHFTRVSPSQGELTGKNAVQAARDGATVDREFNKKYKSSHGYSRGVSVKVKVGSKK